MHSNLTSQRQIGCLLETFQYLMRVIAAML
jgi:hypothetical protein